MASPIRNTLTLYGEDDERFLADISVNRAWKKGKEIESRFNKV